MPRILKWLAPLAVIISNIIFSFYYSSQIIKQNQLFNHYQNTYNSLLQQHFDLQLQLAGLQSINTLNLYARTLDLTPLSNYLKIPPSSP